LIIRLWTPDAKVYDIGPFETLRVTEEAIMRKCDGQYKLLVYRRGARWFVGSDEKLEHLRGFVFDFLNIENE
jgi:hypothetical protein